MDELKAQLLEIKITHDIYNEALKIAYSHSVPEQDLRLIIQDKSDYVVRHLRACEAIIKKMNNATNIVSIGDGWWGIRYAGEKKEVCLRIEMIDESDIHLLQKDSRRELTRMDLESLLPAIILYDKVAEYKLGLQDRAKALIKEYCGFTVDASTADIHSDINRPTSISFHAGTRWVQRVYKMYSSNDKMAEEYRRLHQKKIEEELLSRFKSAEHVWTSEDNMQFFFDSDNIMYVKGPDNTIVTLYEEDFGFSKGINRNIVFEQLNVLRDLKSSLSVKEDETYTSINVLEAEMYDLSEELRLKEAEISLIKSRQTLASSQRDDLNKALTKDKVAYSVEHNKLFKKFEV